MIAILAGFAPSFAAGFAVNIEIALCSVLAGIGFGLPLALLRLRLPGLRRMVRFLIMLMQAAPVYVIMFLLLNVIPKEVCVLGSRVAIGGIAAVILSQSVNMAAYMCETIFAAMVQWRLGQRDRAMLLFPSILRGFFIVLMSSGFGAAVGVAEAVGVTLRQAEKLPELRDRVLLFLVVIGFFVTVLGLANLAVGALVRRCARPAHGLMVR